MTTPTQPIPLTDLRLYNYVNYEGLPQQIVCIDLSGLTTLYIGESEYLTVDHNKISGIPLTEEWFIRFGFKFTHLRSKYYKEYETDYRWRIRHREDQGYAYVVIDNNCCFDDEEFSKPLIYVSDLQNIYYFLTGTELTIK